MAWSTSGRLIFAPFGQHIAPHGDAVVVRFQARQQRPDVALARGSKNQLVLTGLGESRCCDQSIRLLRRHFPALVAILLERRKVVAPLIELAVSNRPQFLPTPGRRESPGTPDKLMRNAIAAGEFWLCAG
jgi:hypothetical protein